MPQTRSDVFGINENCIKQPSTMFTRQYYKYDELSNQAFEMLFLR